MTHPGLQVSLEVREMMAELSCSLQALPGHPVTLGLGLGTNYPVAWGCGDSWKQGFSAKSSQVPGKQGELVTLQGPKGALFVSRDLP